jgi:hypothetical protein
MSHEPTGRPPEEEVLKRLSAEPSPGMLRELFALMRHNKKWWLIPAIAVLLVAAALIVLAGSGAAPFVYTLF